MQMPFKIRMWNNVPGNPDACKMFYYSENVLICLQQQARFYNGHKLSFDHISAGSVFMCSTGIISKNKKEVFDGDIVRVCFSIIENYGKKVKHNFTGVICFGNFESTERDGCYDFIIGWYIKTKDGNFSLGNFDDELRVIGNRYENPELYNNIITKK